MTVKAEESGLTTSMIIVILYAVGFFLPIAALAGVIVAHMKIGESQGGWQYSHMQYHIRTFWAGLVGLILASLLVLILIGYVLFPLWVIWILIRIVKAGIAAANRQPMDAPKTLLF